jgi:hypothetical protein
VVVAFGSLWKTNASTSEKNRTDKCPFSSANVKVMESYSPRFGSVLGESEITKSVTFSSDPGMEAKEKNFVSLPHVMLYEMSSSRSNERTPYEEPRDQLDALSAPSTSAPNDRMRRRAIHMSYTLH